MSGKKNLAKDIILRPFLNPLKIHPNALKVQERMTRPPEPLKFKLHDLPENYEQTLPPLGNTDHLPFQVDRTHLGNLPVYIKYRNRRNLKRTLVQHVTGDINVKALRLFRNSHLNCQKSSAIPKSMRKLAESK